MESITIISIPTVRNSETISDKYKVRGMHTSSIVHINISLICVIID
jgi:hypothetical protein